MEAIESIYGSEYGFWVKLPRFSTCFTSYSSCGLKSQFLKASVSLDIIYS